ncbi:hypothetical protein LCGC14_1045350 [marine sediment metagenome]|uniref:Uncharacterized protein n=1 Tax=marine sediment metagenome TaxID=412755 RepID=A0A0F9QWP8_9ZZZZ
MISAGFAEKLYEKMQGYHDAELTTDEIETLSKIICSEVTLKAFGRAFSYCKLEAMRITQLDLSNASAVVEYSRGQGRIDAISTVVLDLLNLIIEKDENDDGSP